MKLNKFAYLYSKLLGNHTLKIMKKIPGNLLKNLEKSWKCHGILSVQKSGNPDLTLEPSDNTHHFPYISPLNTSFCTFLYEKKMKFC